MYNSSFVQVLLVLILIINNTIIILTEYFAISAQLLKSNKFTNLEQTPLNGSQQLPAPYKNTY